MKKKFFSLNFNLFKNIQFFNSTHKMSLNFANNLKFFSSSVETVNFNRANNSSNLNNSIVSLNPYWVTGFADGESSFVISIHKASAREEEPSGPSEGSQIPKVRMES